MPLSAGFLSTNGTVQYNSVPLAIAMNTGGQAPYENQWQRSVHGADEFVNVGAPVYGTSAIFTDSTAQPNHYYDYQVTVTDTDANIAISNVVSVLTPSSPFTPILNSSIGSNVNLGYSATRLGCS